MLWACADQSSLASSLGGVLVGCPEAIPRCVRAMLLDEGFSRTCLGPCVTSCKTLADAAWQSSCAVPLEPCSSSRAALPTAWAAVPPCLSHRVTCVAGCLRVFILGGIFLRRWRLVSAWAAWLAHVVPRTGASGKHLCCSRWTFASRPLIGMHFSGIIP